MSRNYLFQEEDHVIAKSTEEIFKIARKKFSSLIPGYINFLPTIAGKKYKIVEIRNVNKNRNIYHVCIDPNDNEQGYLLMPEYFVLDEDFYKTNVNNEIPSLFGNSLFVNEVV